MVDLDAAVRSFTIKILDVDDVPVTTRTLADFAVTFERNGAACSDVLTLVNNGDGTYTISYTPSGLGQDVISVYDAATDLRFTDVEDTYGLLGGIGLLPRSFIVKIVDIADAPVTTRVLSDFAVTFERDGAACSDALSCVNNGDGTYMFSYTPSAAGLDVITVYDAPTDLRFVDVEDVAAAASRGDAGDAGGVSYCLNRDFGGTGKLAVPAPDPADYRMLVFASEDWAVNRRSGAYAFGTSEVNASGEWLRGVYVPAGTYHVVAQKSGTFVIVAANMAVGSS